MSYPVPFSFYGDMMEEIPAVIAHWVETPSRRGGFSIPASSYGIVVSPEASHGRPLWGAGYSSAMVHTLALAVQRLLREYPANRVVIHAAGDMQQNFGPRGWMRSARNREGRKADGTPFAAYAKMLPVLDALDAGRWRLIAYTGDAIWDAPGYLEAKRIADTIGKDTALKHKAENSPTTLSCRLPVIIREGP